MLNRRWIDSTAPGSVGFLSVAVFVTSFVYSSAPDTSSLAIDISLLYTKNYLYKFTHVSTCLTNGLTAQGAGAQMFLNIS